MKLVIRDHAGGGDLGYHIEGGKPVGFIFAKDDIDAAGKFKEYTSTLNMTNDMCGEISTRPFRARSIYG